MRQHRRPRGGPHPRMGTNPSHHLGRACPRVRLPPRPAHLPRSDPHRTARPLALDPPTPRTLRRPPTTRTFRPAPAGTPRRASQPTKLPRHLLTGPAATPTDSPRTLRAPNAEVIQRRQRPNPAARRQQAPSGGSGRRRPNPATTTTTLNRALTALAPASSTVEPPLSAGCHPHRFVPAVASPAGGAGGGRPSRPPGRRPGGAAGSPAGRAPRGPRLSHGGRPGPQTPQDPDFPGPSPPAALRRPPGEAAPQDHPAKPHRGTTRRSCTMGPPGLLLGRANTRLAPGANWPGTARRASSSSPTARRRRSITSVTGWSLIGLANRSTV